MKELICSSKDVGNTKIVAKVDFQCSPVKLRNTHDPLRNFYVKLEKKKSL